MADEPSSAGMCFSEDLRRIREARGVTVEDIHSETQIPRTLIESFERGELYDHPTYNQVYLRSFIKAYSDAIGISREAALSGLEAALDETYEEALAVQYLSEADEAAAEASFPDETTREEGSDETDQEAVAEPEETSSEGEGRDDRGAGGPSGRGGIVGPPRAVGDEDKPTIEEVSSPDANVKGMEETDESSGAEEEATDEDPADKASQEQEVPQEQEASQEQVGSQEEAASDAADAEEEAEAEAVVDAEDAEDAEGETESVEGIWGDADESGEDASFEAVPDGVEGDEDASQQESASEEGDVFQREEASGEQAASQEQTVSEEEDDAVSDDDVEAAREKLEELSGPEALRSTPDEAEDDADPDASDRPTASEDVPAWRAEQDDAEESPDASRSLPDDQPDIPPGDDGETGIVGEPTAMGEGGGKAVGSAPGSVSADRSGSDGLWDRANKQIYVTGIGIVVVLLVLIGVGIAYFNSGGGEEATAPADEALPEPDTAAVASTVPDTAASATAADTAAAEEEAEEEAEDRPPPADVSLGSQIFLTVYATEPVSGIRIRRDEDLRRPYWLEAESASVFPFERRAVVRAQLDKVQLYVEGYRYPIAPTDTAGGLELTRARVEAFVDTLRGQPASLSVAPDTIPVGGPPAESSAGDVPADTAGN